MSLTSFSPHALLYLSWRIEFAGPFSFYGEWATKYQGVEVTEFMRQLSTREPGVYSLAAGGQPFSAGALAVGADMHASVDGALFQGAGTVIAVTDGGRLMVSAAEFHSMGSPPIGHPAVLNGTSISVDDGAAVSITGCTGQLSGIAANGGQITVDPTSNLALSGNIQLSGASVDLVLSGQTFEQATFSVSNGAHLSIEGSTGTVNGIRVASHGSLFLGGLVLNGGIAVDGGQATLESVVFSSSAFTFVLSGEFSLAVGGIVNVPALVLARLFADSVGRGTLAFEGGAVAVLNVAGGQCGTVAGELPGTVTLDLATPVFVGGATGVTTFDGADLAGFMNSIMPRPLDSTDTTSLAGLGSGGDKWWGGVLGGDGRIYGIPANADAVLVIDPAAGTTDTTSLAGLGSGGEKWLGGVLGDDDGRIFGIPQNTDAVLVIR